MIFLLNKYEQADFILSADVIRILTFKLKLGLGEWKINLTLNDP